MEIQTSLTHFLHQTKGAHCVVSTGASYRQNVFLCSHCNPESGLARRAIWPQNPQYPTIFKAMLIALLTELLSRERNSSRGISKRDFKRIELIQELIAFPATKSQKAHRANKEHFNGIVRGYDLSRQICEQERGQRLRLSRHLISGKL